MCSLLKLHIHASIVSVVFKILCCAPAIKPSVLTAVSRDWLLWVAADMIHQFDIRLHTSYEQGQISLRGNEFCPSRLWVSGLQSLGQALSDLMLSGHSTVNEQVTSDGKANPWQTGTAEYTCMHTCCWSHPLPLVELFSKSTGRTL